MSLFVLADDRAADTPVAPNPEFGLAGVGEIRLHARWQNRQAQQYLASRVMRNSADLISHMRRIWLHRDIGDAAGAAGAAIDLFIAAQTRGRELRQRALRIVADELRECGCYEALQEALDGGLSRHDPRIARAESLLCRPVHGRFDFVRRQPRGNDTAAGDAQFDWSLDSGEDERSK